MKSINLLIAAFATLLVGMMLISSVASETYGKTGKVAYVTEESLNISSTHNGDSPYVNSSIELTLANKGVKCSNGEGRWKVSDIKMTNASGTLLGSGNYTINNNNNTISFKNTTTTDVESLRTAATGAGFFNASNITLVNYSYYPSDYMCEGWSRASLNIVPGFFGIAILLISVGLFYAVAKQEGIIGQI